MDWQAKLPFLRWNATGDAVTIDWDDDGKAGWQCVDGSVIPFGTDPRLAEYEARSQAEWLERLKRDRVILEEVHDQIINVDDPEPFPRDCLRKRPGFAAWLAGQNQHYRPTAAELFGFYPAYMERLRLLNERRLAGPGTDGDGVDCLVTLQQMAAMVNRSKKTLERRKKNMPMPKVAGGGGKPDEWAWDEIRPWLEKEFERPLPKRFPGNRLRPI